MKLIIYRTDSVHAIEGFAACQISVRDGRFFLVARGSGPLSIEVQYDSREKAARAAKMVSVAVRNAVESARSPSAAPIGAPPIPYESIIAQVDLD